MSAIAKQCPTCGGNGYATDPSETQEYFDVSQTSQVSDEKLMGANNPTNPHRGSEVMGRAHKIDSTPLVSAAGRLVAADDLCVEAASNPNFSQGDYDACADERDRALDHLMATCRELLDPPTPTPTEQEVK